MNHRFPAFFSIRGKMTLAALGPLAFTLALVWMAAFYLIDAWVVGESQKKVRQDLTAAREVLRHEEERVAAVVRFVAHGTGLKQVLQGKELPGVAGELMAVQQREGLDLLTLTDAQGRIVLRGSGVEGGGQPAPLPFLDRLLQGEKVCSPVLLTAEELRLADDRLAQRARIPLSTALTLRRGEAESRGLLLACGKPVLDGQGELLGALYGGILLNGNLPLIDRIRDVVFGAETFDGVEVGSATLFLDDIRIATTIRLKDGGRAHGTPVSPAVAEAVLQRRETWVARAQVVDEWYLTAYEPIIDSRGEAIGALYVGLLERPFVALKARAVLTLLALLVFGGGLGYLLARTISRRLSRPLVVLEGSARRVTGGERDMVLPVTTRDEVGHLTVAFNTMTAALQEQEQELQSLNRGLERKVEERTAALEEKSLQLIRAQEELARAERLAAIGSLAAGVAHEINNPAAIIRGNVEILLATLAKDRPEREEIEEILQQTERLSRITGDLLAFSREQIAHLELVAIHSLLDEVLAGVGHQVDLGQVEIRRQYDPALPPVEADGERLRQVFNNLLLNALQAMDGSGILTVATRLEAAHVEIEIGDTGPGVPDDIRGKIFHPFFTTRRRGTGLGLSISYGIVRAHQGSIEVESEKGKGSLFRVILPRRQGKR